MHKYPAQAVWLTWMRRDGTGVRVVRQAIAGVEHMSDPARALTKRIDRLLEGPGQG
jgi:hypothetical protein